MIKALFSTLVGSVTARWVTAIGVTLLLSLGALSWHNYKQALRDEGIQICNEEIYKQNQAVLEKQLELEKQKLRDLEIELQVVRAYNEDANRRLLSAESAEEELRLLRKQQEASDDVYKEWSDTALPDGVAGRLRDLQGGSANQDRD